MFTRTGIWVGYRKDGDYDWTPQDGSGFLVTEMDPESDTFDDVYTRNYDRRKDVWRPTSNMNDVKEDHRAIVENFLPYYLDLPIVPPQPPELTPEPVW